MAEMNEQTARRVLTILEDDSNNITLTLPLFPDGVDTRNLLEGMSKAIIGVKSNDSSWDRERGSKILLRLYASTASGYLLWTGEAIVTDQDSIQRVSNPERRTVTYFDVSPDADPAIEETDPPSPPVNGSMVVRAEIWKHTGESLVITNPDDDINVRPRKRRQP